MRHHLECAASAGLPSAGRRGREPDAWEQPRRGRGAGRNARGTTDATPETERRNSPRSLRPLRRSRPRAAPDQRDVAAAPHAPARHRPIQRRDNRPMQVTMTVNGEEHTRDIEPRLLLVHFLRDELDLTGTHWVCDTSNCGTCVVLMDGEPAKSCTVLAATASGYDITTVEGLERDGVL